MSKAKPRVSIVGLGLIGSSIGLALRQAEVTSTVTGHDRTRQAGNEAKRIGAVDKTHWNLISTCEDADLVILATPLGGIKDTMAAIGPYLRPGCVVMDTATLKKPVMAWAAEHLSDQVNFVGGDPILGAAAGARGEDESARADLFQKGLFCLVPSPSADPDAVELVSNLVSILGAKPLFLDAEEHDGLLAGVDHLPSLATLALLEAVIHQPSWRELRKVAGSSFEDATRLIGPSVMDEADLFLLNSENVLRWLDALSASLAALREELADGQSEALASRFEKALQERHKWLSDRAQGRWRDGPETEMPDRPSMMDTFLGSFWRRKRKKDS